MGRARSRTLCAGNLGPGTLVLQQLLVSVSPPPGGAPQGRHLYIFLTGPSSEARKE